MLGDVVPNPREILPASNLDDPIGDAYPTAITVLAALHVLEVVPAPIEDSSCPLDQLRWGQGSLNVVESEPGKLLAGVAEPVAGRFVELGKTQRFGVDQHDTVSGLIENGAVDFLPFSQRFLRRPHHRDVASDAKYTDKAAVGIAHGRLDGFEQAAITVGGKGEPFFVDARPAGRSGGPVVRLEKIGQFWIDKIVVGLADDHRFAGSIQALEGRVAEQIDPFGIL